MIIVRELTGGLYFGERKTVEENGVRKAIDTLTYDEKEIRRIAVKAFEIAKKRRKKVIIQSFSLYIKIWNLHLDLFLLYVLKCKSHTL